MATAKETILARIESVCETIEVGESSNEMIVVQTGKIHAEPVLMPEFRSRDVFLAVMSDVLGFARQPDFDSIEVAIKEDPDAAEEFSKALDGLKTKVYLFQEYYKPYVNSIEVLQKAIGAMNDLFKVLGDLYRTGDLKSAERLFNSIKAFVVANVAMADDVYRDDVVGKTIELPSFNDDAPMTWPAPCESELAAGLPSREEISPLNDVFGMDSQTDLDPIIPHTEGEVDPVLMKDWVARLWGKASRLCDGGLIELKVRVQVPRLVMYTFYDEFLRTACQFSRAIEDYRSGKLGPLRGSLILKPLIGGVRLPWFMEMLLLFAPREYFTPECNHYGYMMLCSAILDETLKNLCTAVTKIDTRDIARDACAVKDAYKRFFNFLCADPPSCTRREYAVQAKEIVDAFKAAYIRLADGLAALECEMEKKKVRRGTPHRRTVVSVPKASEATGIPAITIRRAWKDPLCKLKPPLDQTLDAVIAWGKVWNEAKSGEKAAKHEANAKNHPIPLASVGKAAKRKAGVD